MTRRVVITASGTGNLDSRGRAYVAGLFIAEECGSHALKGVPEPAALKPPHPGKQRDIQMNDSYPLIARAVAHR
jgi:hypothetical protein